MSAQKRKPISMPNWFWNTMDENCIRCKNPNSCNSCKHAKRARKYKRHTANVK